MFDSHIHRNGADYPQTVTVHEHAAPTAESIKLLREMEDAAWQKVVEASVLNIGENRVESIAITKRLDPLSLTSEIQIIFRLNGELHSLRVKRNPLKITAKEIILEFAGALAAQIAEILTQEALKNSKATELWKP